MRKKYMTMRIFGILAAFVLTAIAVVSCGKGEPVGDKLTVMTSIFPIYDMARAVGGSDVELSLLIPPGTEAHTFEPTPSDIVRLEDADVFIYNGANMEPWVEGIVSGVKNPDLLVVDTSRGITLRSGEHHEGEHHEGEHHEGEPHEGGGHDPHVWLDFDNAKRQIDAIAAAFETKDGEHAASYRERAEAYKVKFDELDALYREAFVDCGSRVIVSTGHFAFGYLAARYGLDHVSIYGLSPDAEPTPERITSIIKLVENEKIRYLFAEEMIDPRLTATIQEETGAEILYVSSGGELSKEQFDRGVTLIDLMKDNLDQFKRGLSCK